MKGNIDEFGKFQSNCQTKKPPNKKLFLKYAPLIVLIVDDQQSRRFTDLEQIVKVYLVKM